MQVVHCFFLLPVVRYCFLLPHFTSGWTMKILWSSLPIPVGICCWNSSSISASSISSSSSSGLFSVLWYLLLNTQAVNDKVLAGRTGTATPVFKLCLVHGKMEATTFEEHWQNMIGLHLAKFMYHLPKTCLHRNTCLVRILILLRFICSGSSYNIINVLNMQAI